MIESVNGTQFIYAASYRKAVRQLPLAIRGKASDAIDLFMNGERELLHFEKVLNAVEPGMSSIRIDDNYRIILCYDSDVSAYCFLYADTHDPSYRWALKKRLNVNDYTNTVQLYDVKEMTVAQEPAVENVLFPEQRYSNKILLRIGVPEPLLPLVRTLTDTKELSRLGEENIIPFDVAYHLDELASGEKAEKILQEIDHNKAASEGDPMRNPDTLSSFVIGPVDPETRRAFAADLEDWRVFLHPSQRDVAQRTFTGPALVKGAAGTGKTVAALHRAKNLAARMIAEKAPGRILYTCFNTTLAFDIEDRLKKICTRDEYHRIDVQNIDALLGQLHACIGYEKTEILYPGSNSSEPTLRALWEQAIAQADPDCRSIQPLVSPYCSDPMTLFRREWDNVAAERGAFTLEDYLSISRTGGGAPLSRQQRTEIWKVFQVYLDLSKERNKLDSKTAMYLFQTILEKELEAGEEPRYRHVIVDEVQDFTSPALRLVRTLAGEEHENDLFLVGDPRQRIYDRRTNLSACGIRIPGRVHQLRFNYRTTQQLQQAAFHVIDGQEFDDLDGGQEDSFLYHSFTSGPWPEARAFATFEEEAAWVREELQKLLDQGVPSKDICLVAPTLGRIKDFTDQLKGSGLRFYQFEKAEDRGIEGIRLCTIYRVKGLEFHYVFVGGLSEKQFSAKRNARQNRRLMYVALTRAQKGAYVSGSGTPVPSFLTELKDPERN